MATPTDSASVLLAAVGEERTVNQIVLENLLRLAQQSPTSVVHLVHVVDVLPGSEWALRDDAWTYPGAAALRTRAEELLRESADGLSTSLGRPIQQHLEVGPPAQRLLDVARRVDADVIVLGPFDKSAVRRALFGSTAEAVLRGAPCSVLIARSKASAT